MKKLLLFAGLLIGGLSQLNAQCVISAACTPSAIGYCTVPEENTSLPNGTETVPYTTDIQFTLGTSAGGFATITDATISSVSGLPAGLNYSTNPVNGTIPAGSSACMQITGTPSAAGSYSVAVTFNVNTSVFPTTQTLTWFLTIDPNVTGIRSYSSASNFYVFPNPASSEITISSAAHFGKVKVIDALGKTVLTHDAGYTAQAVIDISTLTKGIYFLQANDGDKTITRKFIKD